MALPEGVLRRLPSLAALEDRTYARVWAATMLANSGEWMQITGRAALVYAAAGSTEALGTVYFFSYIPQLLFSLTGGALADRLARRRLVIAGNLAQATVALGLALMAVSGRATVPAIAALSFLSGTVQAMVLPPTLAVLPSLVAPSLIRSAMTLNGMTYSASRIAGPLVAGLLIPVTGVAGVFATNAALLVVVALVWWRTVVPPAAPGTAAGNWAATVEGVRHVLATGRLRILVAAVAVLSFVGFAYQPLAVAYATDVLAGGAEAAGARAYGLLQAAMGVGSVVGILGLAETGRRRPGAALASGIALFSAALVGLATVDRLGPALVLGAVVAGCHIGSFVLIQTLVQADAPEALRGRLMSVLLLAWVGLLPFASLVAGAVADRLGVPATYLGAGLVCLGLGAVLAAVRGRLATPGHGGPSGLRDETHRPTGSAP